MQGDPSAVAPGSSSFLFFQNWIGTRRNHFINQKLATAHHTHEVAHEHADPGAATLGALLGWLVHPPVLRKLL